jgi:hypothetical protein
MEMSVAYDEALAARVRDLLAGRSGVVEKRMFGGLAFMVDGNMACCVSVGGLMVRLPPGETAETLAEPGVGPSVMKGRPMRGWVLVGPEGHAQDADLQRWVGRGVARADQLPSK